VPFGEYIPFKKIFAFLETVVPIGDFTRGKEYTVFNLPLVSHSLPLPFSTLICFEDIFPELATQFVKRGAGFLVNITNDAWFRKSSSPYQHLAASVFRAVENRLFLVRAANTGVSAFINPVGKIVSLVADNAGKAIFISGYRTETISVGTDKKPTFYTSHPKGFILLCLILVVCGIIITISHPSFKGGADKNIL
jgi:apolipoprotein N-acyltransferase